MDQDINAEEIIRLVESLDKNKIDKYIESIEDSDERLLAIVLKDMINCKEKFFLTKEDLKVSIALKLEKDDEDFNNIIKKLKELKDGK